MVKTQRAFILAAAVLSGIGAAISFLSLGSESWVSCPNCRLLGENLEIGVEYGLFKGVFKSYFSKVAYEIEMTCLWDKAVCAQLCAKNAEKRHDLLEKLYNGETITEFDINCPQVPFTLYQLHNKASKSTNMDGKFINLGCWFTTIFFLVLSAIVGLVAALIAVWNFASNPIEIYFSIFGLYIYNAIALGLNIIYITIFGAHYAQTIMHNLAVQYTIVGLVDSYGAVLGWSYWISLVPMICYTGSIVLFYIRQYLINQEPKHNIHPDTTEADPTIYIF